MSSENQPIPADSRQKQQRSLKVEKVLVIFRKCCGVRFTHYPVSSPPTFTQQQHYKSHVDDKIDSSMISSGTVSHHRSLPTKESTSLSANDAWPLSTATPTRSYQHTIEKSIVDLPSLLSWWEDKSKDLDRDQELLAFIKEIFRQMHESSQLKRYQLFQQHVALAQQLKRRESQNNNNIHTTDPSMRCFPCLPSMDDPPLLNPLLNNINKVSSVSEDTHRTSIAVPMKISQPKDATTASTLQIQYLDTTASIKNRKWKTATIGNQPLKITGTHPPWPPSTSTIYLKSNFAVEDTLVPTHVPYFGDDDTDDVLSGLSGLFDLEEWKQRGIHGPDYKKVEDDNLLDQALELLIDWVQFMIHILQGTITSKLSDMEDTESYHLKILETIMSRLMKHIASASDREIDFVNSRYLHRMNQQKASKEAIGDCHVILPSSEDTSKVHKLPEVIKAVKIARTNWDYTDKYTTLMDSYRALFCRRCFSYDCNNHGTSYSPSLDLQNELACKKETDGSWNMVPSLTPIRTPNISLSHELSDLQKLLLKRVYLICQGNPSRISLIFRCDEAVIQKHIEEQGLSPADIMTARLSSIREGKDKKTAKKGRYATTSLSKYDRTALKRAYSVEIRPSFEPCDHGFDPCTKDNCSCVQSALFCTKHGSLGALS